MESTDAAKPQRPSTGLAILAAILPVVFVTIACPFYAMSFHGLQSAAHAFAESGIWGYAVIAASMMSTLFVAVFLFVHAKGLRIPAAATVFTAALPWLVGIVGARAGMFVAADAIRNANVVSRAAMMSRGISEATQARLIGAVVSAALLAATAFGLAIASVALRAPGRSALGALVGAAAAVPLVGIGIYGALVLDPVPMVLVAITSIGALIAIAIGGFGAGADEHGRSGALASSTPIAAGLALAAALVAASAMSMIFVFGALGNADPAARSTIVAAAAAELGPLSTATTFAAPLALLAAAVLAGWTIARSRPTVGRVAGAIALVLTVALVLGSDALTMRYAETSLAGFTARAWDDVESFTAMELPHDDGRGGEPSALLTPSGLATTDGNVIARYGDAELGARIAALPTRREDEWLSDGSDRTSLELASGPTLGVDARLTIDALRRVLEAASASGVRAIVFAGDGPRPSPEAAAAIADTFPMLSGVTQSRGGVRVVLAGTVPAGERVPYHVVVGSVPATQIEQHAGEPRSLDGYDRGTGELVYVAIDDGATASSVLVTASRIGEQGFTPVLLTSPLPRVEAPPPIGLGDGLGTLGAAPEVDGDGSLSRDAIHRVIRSRQHEIRDCYERALVRRADLGGRVEVSFTVALDGSVSEARIGETTLNDPSTETCIVDRVRGWGFPRPDGEPMQVRYPFVFRPE